MFAGLDGEGGLTFANALCRRDRIKTLFINGDGRGCLSCTPNIVFQIGFHHQDSTAIIAEVMGHGNDVGGGIQIGEVEGVHLLAAVRISVREGVGAGLVVNLSVPEVVFASLRSERYRLGMVDDEVDGDDAVAACKIVGVDSEGGVCEISYAVPYNRIAVGVGLFGFSGMVDGELKSDSRVAAHCVDGVEGGGSALVVSYTMPNG